METSKLLCTVVNFDGSAMNLSLLLFIMFLSRISFMHIIFWLSLSFIWFFHVLYSFNISLVLSLEAKYFFRYYFSCMYECFPACMYVHHICTVLYEGKCFPGTGFTTGTGELPHAGWECYLGHLSKQHMLLTMECYIRPKITSRLDKNKKLKHFFHVFLLY